MPARPHWLSQAGATSTPEVVVSFDTETTSEKRAEGEVMRLRCWSAIVRTRYGQGAGRDDTTAVDGETSGQLAAVLEGAAGVVGEAWAFAQNVGFDLTVTSLPMVLGERGWVTDFVSIGEEACIFVLKRNRCKLVITDSWSWLRSPLAAAAKDVGMRTRRLPGESASLGEWQQRCAHDVVILDRLLADLLEYWDRADLGRFGTTGAACGWRALRAHVAPKAVLVGPEPPRTTFERRALYSGRKEVWQVGEVRRRWVADYDLAAAHLTIASAMLLPAAPIRDRRIGLLADPLSPPDGLGSICEVEIQTETPCAPVHLGDDVWWPTGTFRTVLTSAELAHVVTVAERVDVLQASWYRLTDGLQDWGRWCLALLDAEDPDVPAVMKRVAKGWGRSVPGRFALRVSTLIGERPATHLGWSIETGVDADTGDQLESISWGGVERTYRRDQDGRDTFPAVLAFVEGHLRAAMAVAIAQRPQERLLQVNTDGWWEVCADGREDASGDLPGTPFRVVRRAHERGVTVRGPNHVESPSDRRLSGVPKDAAQLVDGSFEWQDWPGLRWQLEFSRPGEYLRPRRQLELAPHYCRRWVLHDGETVPVSVRTSASGEPSILPWPETSGRFESDQLAALQVPALELLRGGDAAAGAPGRPAGLRRPGRR